MENERREIWISKYALTKGVYSAVCRVSSSDYAHSGSGYSVIPPGHWHNTKAEAVKQAERMRAAKLKSLKAQIKRLEELEF